jgi:hypothetical protein
MVLWVIIIFLWLIWDALKVSDELCVLCLTTSVDCREKISPNRASRESVDNRAVLDGGPSIGH